MAKALFLLPVYCFEDLTDPPVAFCGIFRPVVSVEIIQGVFVLRNDGPACHFYLFGGIGIAEAAGSFGAKVQTLEARKTASIEDYS